jgi:uncharacterized protein YbaP (TraB family)
MLKKLFYFVILLFHCCSLTAQTDSLIKPVENSLIWKIEGNGLPNPSYLMGTLHAIPIGNIDTSQKLKDLIFSCTRLFTEKSDSLIAAIAFLPGDDHVKNHLKKRHYKQLKKAIEFYSPDSVETDSIYKMKSQFYTNIILGYKAQVYFTSYEEYLILLANSKNIATDGLESFEEIAYIEKVYSPKDGFVYLSDFIENIDIHFEIYKRSLKEYQTRNINNFYFNQLKFNAQRTTDMLDKRNLNWMPKIKLAIKKESCFFAVGSAHLAGNNGLVNLLRKEGYAVTPY